MFYSYYHIITFFMLYLCIYIFFILFFFFFQAEDGIRDLTVTGVQTCALPICSLRRACEFVHRRHRLRRRLEPVLFLQRQFGPCRGRLRGLRLRRGQIVGEDLQRLRDVGQLLPGDHPGCRLGLGLRSGRLRFGDLLGELGLFQRFEEQAHLENSGVPALPGLGRAMKSSPGIIVRNERKSPSMLASLTTIGRKKTTSSVLVLLRLRELNSEPRNGMELMIGIVSSMSLIESSINPPSTAIWPLLTLMSVSISRMRSCGIKFGIPALRRSGFGSETNLTTRVVVGFTFNRIVSLSLI